MNIKEFQEKKNKFLIFLEKNKNLSKNTLKSYNADLELIINFWSEKENQEKKKIYFEKLILDYVNLLFNSQINSSSIARKISCFNSFKKFLKVEGINLDIKFNRPFVNIKKPEILNFDEIINLMNSINNIDLPTSYPLRDIAILELFYATGITCSELVEIELNNIDLKNQTIIIRNRSKKERIVIFGNNALKKIVEYLKKERIAPINNNEKLFLNYKNEPISVRSIQRICNMFEQFISKKKNLTPAILRNSFANHMLKNGAEINTMQELLGHKTRISTERYLNKK